MNRFYQFFFLITILTFSSTCKRVETKSDTGESYFPLHLGMVKIFSVDSVIYNAIANKKDSTRTYVKEIITEEKTDSSGYTVFKTECYSSEDTSNGWTFSSYFFYKRNEYHINLVKGGSIVTYFVFPVTKGRKWNMNAFNSSDPEYAYYSFVANPWTNYADCVEVFVKDDINIIEETIDKRIYSREKGLVYKIQSNITIDNSKKNGYRVITTLVK